MKVPHFALPKLIRNPHLQTLLPNILALKTQSKTTLTTYNADPNNQFVLAHRQAKNDSQKPILLIIPGIEGSYESPVVKLLMAAKELSTYDMYALSHRGIGTPNCHFSPYHAGFTDDLAAVIPEIRKKHPGRPIHTIGYSMGANVLLNYLSKNHGTIDKAIAISTPFDLQHCISYTPSLYQKQILKGIRQRTAQCLKGTGTLETIDWGNIQTMRDFDNRLTAPCFGFRSADDYYQQTSSIQVLEKITCPTWMISAADDPFVSPQSWPKQRALPRNLRFVGTENGGHMGFIYFNRGFHNWIAEVIQHHCG